MASDSSCRATRKDHFIDLCSPSFTFRLGTSGTLTANAWTNLLTGTEVPLGNHPEVDLDLDAADRRIFITGWRVKRLRSGEVDPDGEEGFRSGFAAPFHDDTGWQGMATPVFIYENETLLGRDYRWARTHVVLPEDAGDADLTLVLGGVGLFDFRYMRVFINGFDAGVRREDARWHAPGEFPLGPGSPAHRHLLFGRDNVIALQLSGLVTRTARLDAVDPQKARWLVGAQYWPGQFEQYLVVGRPLRSPRLTVSSVDILGEGACGEVAVTLTGRRPSLSVVVTYRWDASEPVLRRFVEVQNRGRSPVRLMNVRLGRYAPGIPVSEGEQGFPVYLRDQFFVTLAHPSGWATGQDGEALLRQYPGRDLAPGERFSCMEAVLGVAGAEGARQAFLRLIQGRMRRVRRGHDRAYAIFDCFGAWPDGDWWGSSEAYLVRQVREVVAAEQRAGCAYDGYVIELWQDRNGDAARPDPKNYPNGFEPVVEALRDLGIAPGFWVCTSASRWSIHGNPATGGAYTHDTAYGADYPWFCLAAEPVRTMYRSAFLRLVREQGARWLKMDGTSAICHNPAHGHLPGIYATEAIHEALIETLRALDAECPDLFIMHYWGPRSPWWLEYGDTLFEPGLQIEAAHPSASPALYARDSVTIGLDQAQRWAEDVPPLGKDSLGVWLSEWNWNSSIGKERWQEGFVMDMCRGSLLAQPWSDDGSLSDTERRQMADFIALLKARPDCFGNPRPVLGNPWRHEPYGVACGNGSRAFIAVNNYGWTDRTFELRFGPAWGLSEGGAWDLYRWYPDPARLRGVGGPFESTAALSLRPFEVVLLEAVPAGTPASLGRSFESRDIAAAFAEPSQELTAEVGPGGEADLPVPLEEAGSDSDKWPPKRSMTVTCRTPACVRGGTLTVSLEMKANSVAGAIHNVGRYFGAKATVAGQQVAATPVLGLRTFDAPWQGWRIAVPPSDRTADVVLSISARLNPEVETGCRAHFIPAG